MNRWKWLGLVLLSFCCSKPLPALEGMDLQRWKQDKNACDNLRVNMRDALDREKEKLLGLNQLQVVGLLGNPDENELYSRNQKFFYYFLEPAASCKLANDSLSERLVIRFNAMGLAKEVAIE